MPAAFALMSTVFSGQKEICTVCFPSDWSELNATARRRSRRDKSAVPEAVPIIPDTDRCSRAAGVTAAATVYTGSPMCSFLCKDTANQTGLLEEFRNKSR